MADHPRPGTAPVTDPSHALPAAGESTAEHHHRHPEEKPHPSIATYGKVAFILTVITIVEVWVYYIPAFVASRLFVPSLLIMSAVKFWIVVMFYMHLRYDHKLFKTLFTGPLIIAVTSVIALLFLFGQVALKLA